jgi:ribosomal protein S13
MADAAAMRTAMQRLGCTAEAAQAIVNDQGIDSLVELKSMKDDDVTTLCKVIRRPGGTIPSQPECWST